MRQLTIKELAPYLPYNLRILRPDNRTILTVCGLTTYGINNRWHYHFKENGNTIGDMQSKGNKPILRPLSDLTVEIEHNGEKFVPIEKLLHIAQENLYGYKIDSLFKIISGESFLTEDSWAFIQHSERGRNAIFYRQTNQFRWFEYMVDGDIIRIDELVLFQKLFEWHFDVYGLIPDNLAIDINKI